MTLEFLTPYLNANLLKLMRNIFSTGILCFIFLSISGCSIAPEKKSVSSDNISINKNLTFSLLPALDIKKTVSLTQAVSIQHNDQKHNFIAQLEIEDKSFKIVGLSNMGITLFSIYSVGNTYEFKASPVLGDDINLQYLLADLQLTYWPVKKLNSRLKTNNAIMNSNKTKRTLLHNNAEVINIEFSNESRWQKNIIFKHLQRNYTINITTLSLEYL